MWRRWSFRPLDGESISKLIWEPTVDGGSNQCFRPLDGESISKHQKWQLSVRNIICFRPLDGESISKLAFGEVKKFWDSVRFRPLDGESISKRKHSGTASTNYC